MRKRTSRILLGTLTVTVLALTSLALIASHDSPCTAPAALTVDTPRMKAIVSRCYGPPDALALEDIARPGITRNEMLVKVHAAALNPLDWHYMRGKPYIMRLMGSGLGRPNDTRVGVDFAGTVTAVGAEVTRFKPGDAVFGLKSGALGEYLAIREDRIVAHKPANLTFEQAAAVPLAAITALQGLRDQGHLRAGQKVLINGASGGVGTFAVQIAKALGAEVTGVCSTRNVGLVRSLGADHVVDYTQQDFTRSTQRYDVILDNVGNHSLSAYRRVLQPQGTLVIVGGPSENRWLGPLLQPIKATLLSPFVEQRLGLFLADPAPADLQFLSSLLSEGKVTPIIDKRHALSETASAIRYLEAGHARGKVVISLR